MSQVPHFRLIEGGSEATRLSAQEARQLVEQARQQVRHGTGFTSATVAVLEALVFKLANRSTGECWPSLATIAAAARISVDTVKRALARLEKAGLVKRAARWAVWVVNGLSVRVRTSNSYSFARPAAGEGRGVSARCTSKTESRFLNEIRTLRAGLVRQAQVALGWVQRVERDARANAERQLALLGLGRG